MVTSSIKGSCKKISLRSFYRLSSISIVGCVFLITTMSFGADTDLLKLKVKVPSANIREMPDLTAKIIWHVKFGAILDADQKQGKWFRVHLSENEKGQATIGYIHYTTVELIEKVVETQPQSKTIEPKTTTLEEKEVGDVAWILDKKANKQRSASNQGSASQINISFGVIGGINISSLSYSSSYAVAVNWKSIMGFCGGAFLSAKLNKMINIQSEILILQKGYTARVPPYSENSTWTAKICYLEFPIIARVAMPIGNRIKPFISTGPFVSLKLSAKGMHEINNEVVEEVKLEDMRFIDYGFLFGAGCEVNISSSLKTALQARYSLGLANILKQDYSYPGDTIRTRNFSILFSISLYQK